MNRQGIKPASLNEEGPANEEKSVDLLANESITRFDNKKKKKKRGKNKRTN